MKELFILYFRNLLFPQGREQMPIWGMNQTHLRDVAKQIQLEQKRNKYLRTAESHLFLHSCSQTSLLI